MFTLLKTLTVQKRLRIIKIMTSVFMCLGLLMSLKLWTLDHLFPIIKVFDGLPLIADTTTIIITSLLFLFLFLSFFRQYKVLYYGILGLVILLLLEDYMRWQPWIYMYFLFFFIFITDSKIKSKRTLFMLQIILSGTYFWAGVHKLNPYFVNTFPLKMAAIIVDVFGIDNMAIVYKLRYLGYIIPLIEIAIGIGLFVKKYQKTAIVFASLTHIFILIYLIPLGVNYNGVVFPWNVAMLISVWILFYSKSEMYTVSSLKKEIVIYLIAILVWVMPTLNIFGLWHNYASFKLYTGNDTYIFVVINNDDIDTIQPNLKPYIFDSYPELNTQFEIKNNQSIISFYHWSIDELKIPFNLNQTTIKQTINYMHTFDGERQHPISFLIYKEGAYQKLIEKDYLND